MAPQITQSGEIDTYNITVSWESNSFPESPDAFVCVGSLRVLRLLLHTVQKCLFQVKWETGKIVCNFVSECVNGCLSLRGSAVKW